MAGSFAGDCQAAIGAGTAQRMTGSVDDQGGGDYGTAGVFNGEGEEILSEKRYRRRRKGQHAKDRWETE